MHLVRVISMAIWYRRFWAKSHASHMEKHKSLYKHQLVHVTSHTRSLTYSIFFYLLRVVQKLTTYSPTYSISLSTWHGSKSNYMCYRKIWITISINANYFLNSQHKIKYKINTISNKKKISSN